MIIKKISSWVGLLLLGTSMLAQAASPADFQPDSGLLDSVTLYGGQGANHNLRELPGVIARGDIEWEKSYFFGVGLGKTGPRLGQSIELLQDTPLAELKQNYELILLKHHGLQNNAEIGAAYLLRTPDLQLGPVGVNLAAGTGLSHAMGTPSYEDGPKDNPSRRYPFQFLALFELEWKLRNVESLSFTTRVHHRCGVYGVIAPPNVGSNFMTVGLRYHF